MSFDQTITLDIITNKNKVLKEYSQLKINEKKEKRNSIINILTLLQIYTSKRTYAITVFINKNNN